MKPDRSKRTKQNDRQQPGNQIQQNVFYQAAEPKMSPHPLCHLKKLQSGAQTYELPQLFYPKILKQENLRKVQTKRGIDGTPLAICRGILPGRLEGC